MLRSRDAWAFGTTLAAAAAAMISIAAAEGLLAIASILWIAQRPKRIVWPGYTLPLAAFMAATIASLAMSAQPQVGSAAVRKFVLFMMGLLAANVVTTPARARIAGGVLLLAAAAGSLAGLVQFGAAYRHFLSTGDLADDPMVLARITGFMGHWITFSGEQLLVWCAALPALAILGRRWMIPFGIVSAALILSFTRSVWLGAIAGFIVVALFLPRRTLARAAIPVALVALAASGLIIHRLSFSFQQEAFAPDSGRLQLLRGGIGMITDHPLFGVGPQRVASEFPHYYRGSDLARDVPYYGHLENNILQLGAERGLLCLAAFLWFILVLYAGFIRMLKTAGQETRWIAIGALSALTAFNIAGLFTYNFGDSEVLLLFLFIVSAPFGLVKTALPERTWPTPQTLN